MELQSHTMQSARGARRKTKRVGRGNSSQKGTYSARGMKGQKARSGGKGGNRRRGFKRSLQKIPKMGGFRSLAIKPETITLAMLHKKTSAGEHITPAVLVEKGLLSPSRKRVKIVTSGELGHALTIEGCGVSASAKALIEKVGGEVKL